jgi:hypothetical protein
VRERPETGENVPRNNEKESKKGPDKKGREEAKNNEKETSRKRTSKGPRKEAKK